MLMITNSLYSATSPFLWLSDVYTTNSILIKIFNAATTLFYVINTFFACLMIYINYYFYLDT